MGDAEQRSSARIAAMAANPDGQPPTVAPWTAEAEIELRREAERLYSWHKAEGERLRERNRVLAAAAECQWGLPWCVGSEGETA